MQSQFKPIYLFDLFFILSSKLI